jgi:transcriptional regulator with XRE-family HTH domain
MGKERTGMAAMTGIEGKFEAWRKTNPLRKWRESQEPKVSRATVCAATGVTGNTILKWESGTNTPSFENMLQLGSLMSIRPATDLQQMWDEWFSQRPKI